MKNISFLIIFFITTSICYSQEFDYQAIQAINQNISKKIQSRNYFDAMADCNQAIRQYPQLSFGYARRAEIKILLEDNRGAEADLTKAIDLSETSLPQYHVFERARVRMKLENYKGAIDDYSKLIELHKPAPSNADPLKIELGLYEPFGYSISECYANRGLSKIYLNQKESGCTDLSKAGELGDPNAYEFIKRFCN